MPQPWQRRCSECDDLGRDLQDAWRADEHDVRTQFQETAQSAGREPEAFILPWVMSLAQMPDDQFEALQAARYPRVLNVLRRWRDHATLAGHSDLGDVWRAAFMFDGVARAGYFGLVKRHD
jgi:hypothetical protein